MRKHYYLDKLGVEYPDRWLPNDAREKQWKKERKKYGFDSRETWSLDSTMFMWLYEHLKLFMKHADQVINLNFHVIEVDGVSRTLREWILICLEHLEQVVQHYGNLKEETLERTDEIMKILSRIYPLLWW